MHVYYSVLIQLMMGYIHKNWFSKNQFSQQIETSKEDRVGWYPFQQDPLVWNHSKKKPEMSLCDFWKTAEIIARERKCAEDYTK